MYELQPRNILRPPIIPMVNQCSFANKPDLARWIRLLFYYSCFLGLWNLHFPELTTSQDIVNQYGLWSNSLLRIVKYVETVQTEMFLPQA